MKSRFSFQDKAFSARELRSEEWTATLAAYNNNTTTKWVDSFFVKIRKPLEKRCKLNEWMKKGENPANCYLRCVLPSRLQFDSPKCFALHVLFWFLFISFLHRSLSLSLTLFTVKCKRLSIHWAKHRWERQCLFFLQIETWTQHEINCDAADILLVKSGWNLYRSLCAR